MSLTDPTPDGRFGDFGGRFVPETLIPAVLELEEAFLEAWADPSYRADLDGLLADYAGRPSPMTECHNLSEQLDPYGVDVSTGVESGPGRKDPRLLRAFITTARAAQPVRYEGDVERQPFDWQEEEWR